MKALREGAPLFPEDLIKIVTDPSVPVGKAHIMDHRGQIAAVFDIPEELLGEPGKYENIESERARIRLESEEEPGEAMTPTEFEFIREIPNVVRHDKKELKKFLDGAQGEFKQLVKEDGLRIVGDINMMLDQNAKEFEQNVVKLRIVAKVVRA